MKRSRNQASALGQFAGWAVAAVAIVVIVLACWRIYDSIREKDAPSERVAQSAAPALALKANDAPNWSRASFTLQATDGLRQTSEISWSVKGGRAFMQVRRLNQDSLEFRFVYPFDDMLPEETNALLRTRWSLGPTEPLVALLNISPEQFGQLQAISPATDIPVESADRQELGALFDDYLSATVKAAAEKALVEAVVALDAKYYDRTMQLVQNIATQVRQIFTEEQWTGLSKRFGNSPSGDRTRPTLER